MVNNLHYNNNSIIFKHLAGQTNLNHLVEPWWVEQVFALHSQLLPAKIDKINFKNVQPEEGIGVQIACAHHNHIHLSSAAILL